MALAVMQAMLNCLPDVLMRGSAPADPEPQAGDPAPNFDCAKTQACFPEPRDDVRR